MCWVVIKATSLHICKETSCKEFQTIPYPDNKNRSKKAKKEKETQSHYMQNSFFFLGLHLFDIAREIL